MSVDRTQAHASRPTVDIGDCVADLGVALPATADVRDAVDHAEEMALNGSVLATVENGGPFLTIARTIFEMWLGLSEGSPSNRTILTRQDRGTLWIGWRLSRVLDQKLHEVRFGEGVTDLT